MQFLKIKICAGIPDCSAYRLINWSPIPPPKKKTHQKPDAVCGVSVSVWKFKVFFYQHLSYSDLVLTMYDCHQCYK